MDPYGMTCVWLEWSHFLWVSQAAACIMVEIGTWLSEILFTRLGCILGYRTVI